MYVGSPPGRLPFFGGPTCYSTYVTKLQRAEAHRPEIDINYMEWRGEDDALFFFRGNGLQTCNTYMYMYA